jgi:hypothetical protein
MHARNIWVEQCQAARGIEDEFGVRWLDGRLVAALCSIGDGGYVVRWRRQSHDDESTTIRSIPRRAR